jgi:hypothetical protein
VFGMELQTWDNVFLKGVLDREIAYRHDSGLLKLEGDETLTADAESELEFVTAPCRTLDELNSAIGLARDLALKLAAGVDKQGLLSFSAGDAFAGGKWLKSGTLRIGNPEFGAQPQGTVGVPLRELRKFIEKVLQGLGAEGEKYLDDLKLVRKIGGLDPDKDESPELVGFLTACHIFLICATWNHMPAVTLGEDGEPKNRKLDPDFWRVCSIPADQHEAVSYLRDITYRGQDQVEYLLDPGPDGAYRLLISRDSPKSMFKMLHRTDFHSMFRALPPGQQDRLRTKPGEVPALVWPPEWLQGYRQVFVYPYRADPPDPAAQKAGLVSEYRAEGWAGTNVPPENWLLIAHGPTVDDWWGSVLDGRRERDGTVLPKDLVSPPPGIRGRNPANLAKFPGDDENKREYYGMGAFPMDSSADPPLAVYEHRAFTDHPEVARLKPLTADKWAEVARIFYANFVPRS